MMMSWAAKYYGGAARTFIKGIPAVGAFEVLSGSSRWKATLAAQAPKLEARPSRDIPGPKRWPGVASLPFVLSHKGLHLFLLRELKLNFEDIGLYAILYCLHVMIYELVYYSTLPFWHFILKCQSKLCIHSRNRLIGMCTLT